MPLIDSGTPDDTQTEPENPVKEIRKPTQISTLSIKDALNGMVEDEGDINFNESNLSNESERFAASDLSNNDFSEERVTHLWHAYIEKIKDEQPRIYLALKNQELKVNQDNFLIEVTFINNAQIDDFKKNIKPSLLNYLKENLENSSVNIQETVGEENSQKNTRHLTEKDKLKHMVQKNPSFQRLKKEFDLDFD